MTNNRLLRAIIILGIIAVNIGCDQVSKSIVRHNLFPYTNLTYLHGHLQITRVENTGAFLSLGDNMHGPLRAILLSVFPAVLLVIGINYLLKSRAMPAFTFIGICSIIGGGIGNIYDRIFHGSVTDFIYMEYGPLHTGVFNGADLSITIGALLIIIGLNVKNPPVFFRKKEREMLYKMLIMQAFSFVFLPL